MYNYLIKIEYDGTNFVGWQRQRNGKSIQDSIEKAHKKIFRIEIKIIGAGRTDKGVHAFEQYANFVIKKKVENKFFFFKLCKPFSKKKTNFYNRYKRKKS